MRKYLIRLAVFAAISVFADALLWLAGTQLLASAADRWAAQATTGGWTVAGGRTALCPCETSGWPFAASIAVTDAGLSGGERFLPGGLSWSAGRVSLSVSLLHPRTLVIGIEGAQRLRVSHAPELGFTAQSAVATLPLGDTLPIQADLLITGIDGGIAFSRHPRDVRLEALRISIQASPREKPGFTGRLDIMAHGIGLPDIGRWPLGAFVSRAGATLNLTSPSMPFWDTQAIPGAGGPQAQAEAWRDGGGTLAARDVDLHWGPLRLRGEADLRLDDRLQPAGSGTADVAGTGAALDALADAGVIAPGLATTVKAVLAFMPHTSIAGDPAPIPAVRLPFVLRQNTLSVGQIPIARLNDIAWRRRPPM